MNVLDNLPFQIDVPALLQNMRVRPGSRHEAEILDLVKQAEVIARPKAAFKLVFIEGKGSDTVRAEGIEFKSRVMRVNLDKLERFFAYVCTSGVELQGWADSYSNDLLAGFYADAINQAVLKSAFGGFVSHLSNAYSLINPSAMNPGSLGDWPISQQRPLFDLLGDVEGTIGVHLRETFLMVPTKSVSGILFPAEESFASCQLCPRDNCPNRRAPYDPELFERKYRAPVVQSDTEVPLC
ncbi:MAG: vitamin B12 dependent-methionine synthase activation domain-containing protein [Nitrososphaerales archaeon]